MGEFWPANSSQAFRSGLQGLVPLAKAEADVSGAARRPVKEAATGHDRDSNFLYQVTREGHIVRVTER
jgi:hypothetical protein